MSSNKYGVVGRSAIGQAKRQQILDHMHKVGVPCDSAALLQVIENEGRRTMGSRLQRMTELGELARETRNVGGSLTHFFTPLVKTTAAKFPPSQWVVEYEAKRKNSKNAAKREAAGDEDEFNDKPEGPWHTIHRCSNKKGPIRDQRGQADTRPRCASVMASL